MTLAWGRRCRLVVAPPLPTGYRGDMQRALVIEGESLRVSFKIKKSRKREPNSSEITVYNMAPETRAALGTGKSARVWLSAGYPESIAEICQGDVTYFQAKHDGPTWECKLMLADGGRAFKHARVSESFARGTRHGDILRSIVAQCGFGIGNAGPYLDGIKGQAVNGYSYSGPARQALTDILSANGLTWSVQGNALQVLPAAGYLATSAVLLTPESGLVGSPEWGSPESKSKRRRLKVKSLLQAQLVPGGRVRLESQIASGVFSVYEVEHSGDTSGSDWHSAMELEPT